MGFCPPGLELGQVGSHVLRGEEPSGFNIFLSSADDGDLLEREDERGILLKSILDESENEVVDAQAFGLRSAGGFGVDGFGQGDLAHGPSIVTRIAQSSSRATTCLVRATMTAMASSDGVAPLVALGFTELEARVYAYLVAEGAATGYRIAAGTGKPVANTYKAIESLERKGAALVEDGATRIVRAVEPERVLDALARSHEGERKKAKSALKAATKAEEDGRTYTVGSEEQAVQRARQMLAEATVVALVRGVASLRALLSEDLSDAEGRGVDVAATDGEGLCLAVDGSQCLVAPDGIWTRNAAVARTVFDGLAAEAALGELAAHVEDGAGSKKLQRALAARRRAPVEG